MTRDEVIFSILADTGGGQAQQSTKLDFGYIKKSLPSYRATWIEKDYMRQASPRQLNPYCYQTVFLKYDPLLQASAPTGSVIYKVPPFIGLDNDDGIRFGGTLGGTNTQPINSRPCIKQWIRLYNRSKLATIQSHSYTRMENNPDDVYFLYNNNNGIVEVYNCPLNTEGKLEGILADPVDAPQFNAAVDQYPIDVNSIAGIREIIYIQRTSVDAASPTDNKFETAAEGQTRPPYAKIPNQQQ